MNLYCFIVYRFTSYFLHHTSYIFLPLLGELCDIHYQVVGRYVEGVGVTVAWLPIGGNGGGEAGIVLLLAPEQAVGINDNHTRPALWNHDEVRTDWFCRGIMVKCGSSACEGHCKVGGNARCCPFGACAMVIVTIVIDASERNAIDGDIGVRSCQHEFDASEGMLESQGNACSGIAIVLA